MVGVYLDPATECTTAMITQQSQPISIPQRNTPWRVCVVEYCRNQGKGGHGTEFAFAGLPGVQIVAVADPDQPSRCRLQQETGAAKSYADWQQLLDQEKPDVLCVSSRLPIQHKDVIMGAIQAGCHVYCEKPFAMNLQDADQMIDAANSAGVKLVVAHLARYSAAFHHARAMIQRGDIGIPLSVICRGKEDHRGGGEDMLVLGTHLFDLACFFFGQPLWVMGHVSCDGRDMIKADACDATEPMGLVAGDQVTAMFGFADGVDCHFQSRRGLADDPESRMAITVVGSKAILHFRFDDQRQLRIRHSQRPLEEGGTFDDVHVIPMPDIQDAQPIELFVKQKGGMYLYFAKANRYAAVDLLCSIAEGSEPLAIASETRWSLEMIHGVYASHLSGRMMTLPLAVRTHPLV